MRKGFVVRQKGYEYNDNWYDHDPTQDNYTHLYDDSIVALIEAKKFTADFIADRYVNDFFNDQPYLSELHDIVGENNRFAKSYDINSDVFSKIWKIIKNDIASVLEVEIHEGIPTVVFYSDGTKMYYENNLLHRVGGPAIERQDGSWEYYFKGKKHRLDGPAMSGQYEEENHYIDGNNYWNKEEFQAAKREWIREHRDETIE